MTNHAVSRSRHDWFMIYSVAVIGIGLGLPLIIAVVTLAYCFIKRQRETTAAQPRTRMSTILVKRDNNENDPRHQISLKGMRPSIGLPNNMEPEYEEPILGEQVPSNFPPAPPTPGPPTTTTSCYIYDNSTMHPTVPPPPPPTPQYDTPPIENVYDTPRSNNRVRIFTKN